MLKQSKLICLVLIFVLLPLLTACGSGDDNQEVTIICDDCEVVQLWETSHATRVIGEVKPGETGTYTDKAWSALEGCTFYFVVLGDQEGWVCDRYLDFK